MIVCRYTGTRGTTPKRVTSDGGYLRDLTPQQYSSKKTLQQWPAVCVTVSDLTGPGIKLKPPSPIAM